MQRLTDSKYYDALMRLSIAALTAFFLWREMAALKGFLDSRVAAGLDALAWAAIAAHVATGMFLLLLVCFPVSRRRPVRKSAGIFPRFAALAGLTLGYALLLPRAGANAGYQTLSAAIIGIGGLLCMVVVMQLGRSLSIMPEARRLVTHGLYRHSRHPLHLVEQIVSFGIFLQYRAIEAAAVLVNLALQIRRVFEEEKVLAAAFPEDEDYRRRTARLIPGIY